MPELQEQSASQSNTPPDSLLLSPVPIQTLLDLCSRSPCQNGGRCLQSGTSLSCDCPGGWTGRYCDIPNVSCDVVARNRGK